MKCLSFSANIFCFCNSPSCLQAVCESRQWCFTQLVKKSSSHENISTSVVYGCSEELNSNSTCTQSSLVVCCDKQLCNMPNMLRSELLTVINLHDHNGVLQYCKSVFNKSNYNVDCFRSITLKYCDYKLRITVITKRKCIVRSICKRLVSLNLKCSYHLCILSLFVFCFWQVMVLLFEEENTFYSKKRTPSMVETRVAQIFTFSFIEYK